MSREWKILLAIYIGSLAATSNQFKVPPLMGPLMREFHLTIGVAGWLMSVFSLSGFLLVIPISAYLTPNRLKKAGIIGLISLTLGSLLGALAPHVALLLVGRALEGIGLLMMGVVAPTLINLCFPLSKKGLAMGIWTTWVPVGFVLMFNLSQPLFNLGGWRSVWWFGFVLSVIALGLFIYFVDIPSEFKKETNNIRLASVFMVALQSRDIWYLCMMFATFSFNVVGFGTWAPTYLNQSFALSPAIAAFYTSLIYAGNIPSNIAAGWLINRYNKPRLVYILGFILQSIALLFSFRIQPPFIPLFMVCFGLICGFIATATFIAAGKATGHLALGALSIGTIIWGQNIGNLLGPVSIGKFFAFMGNWQACVFLMIPVAVLGLLLGLLTRVNKEKKIQVRQVA